MEIGVFGRKRRFRARVDPLAFSQFWAFWENFEGGGELEPPLFPLLTRVPGVPPTLSFRGGEPREVHLAGASRPQ